MQLELEDTKIQNVRKKEINKQTMKYVKKQRKDRRSCKLEDGRDRCSFIYVPALSKDFDLLSFLPSWFCQSFQANDSSKPCVSQPVIHNNLPILTNSVHVVEQGGA
jgi:hypothetical protein